MAVGVKLLAMSAGQNRSTSRTREGRGVGWGCPAYEEKRCSLLDYLEKENRIKISRMSPNRIFMFLIHPPSGNVKLAP